MKKKVLLIVPNFRWANQNKDWEWNYIPYNLCLLAACIKDIARVEILDAYHENLTREEFNKRLRYKTFDLVGITCMMDQHKEALHWTACEVKSIMITKVIVGGVYASMNPDECNNDPYIDYVCMGEGEEFIRLLIETDMHLNKHVPPITRTISNLSDFPLPDYSLIDYKSYVNRWDRPSVDRPPILPYGRIMTSRGCPYGCCFCQVHSMSGKEWRPRSVDSIIEEMKYLVKEYGVKSWVFDDDNLLQDRDRAVELFEGMIHEELALPWKSIATPVFKVNANLLMLMKKSGCMYVDYAIESGTQRVLKEIIHKPVDLEKAKEIVTMTKEMGIFVTCNFIIGFPTETWEEIRTTLRVAEEFNADYTKISVATPLRNTELWRLCDDTSSFKPGFNEKDLWSEGQIETEHFKARQLSILRAYEWDRINFSTEDRISKVCEYSGITREELMEERKKTLRRFT